MDSAESALWAPVALLVIIDILDPARMCAVRLRCSLRSDASDAYAPSASVLTGAPTTTCAFRGCYLSDDSSHIIKLNIQHFIELFTIDKIQ
jgi:hypothetical protein